MITAVDTNVIVDVVGGDARFGPASLAALRHCRAEGRLIIGSVVAAEVGSLFPSPELAMEGFRRIGLEFVAETLTSSFAAAISWRAYRTSGGTRSRLVGDFLVGAHAQALADRLLTRDRGFYRTYFHDLAILEPSPAARRDGGS